MAAKNQPPLSKLVCAACGRRLRQGCWVYSRFTKNHYCVEFDACTKRAKRKERA